MSSKVLRKCQIMPFPPGRWHAHQNEPIPLTIPDFGRGNPLGGQNRGAKPSILPALKTSPPQGRELSRRSLGASAPQPTQAVAAYKMSLYDRGKYKFQ